MPRNRVPGSRVQHHVTTFPTDRHQLIYRDACLHAGHTDDDLRRARRRGEIVAVVRGAFVATADRTPEEVHRLHVVATHELGLVTSGVLSHQSAAVIHQLGLLLPDLSRVHVTSDGAAHGGRTAARHDHVGPVPPDEIVIVDGVPVTSLEWTAVDVACTTQMGFAGALAVFDAALRLGADREKLERLVRATRRGIGTARRALLHADPAAENPGESWCRAQIIEAGLTIPRLQHEFHDENGSFIARTDFDWDGLLVGEFDGKIKYQKHLRPGENVTDAVVREKNREDALRRRGVIVVRFTWDDLRNGAVADKIRGWLVTLNLVA